MGCEAVRWQGETTKWAAAHEKEQRRQRTAARLNRVCSVVTQAVNGLVSEILNVHAGLQAATSGQLRFLGSTLPGRP